MNVSCMEYKYARASYGIIGKRVEPTWWPTRIASPHIAHYVSLVLLSIWFGFHLHAEQTLLCLLIYGSRRFFFVFVFLLSVALALCVPAIDAPKHTAPSSWWGEKCCLFSIRFEFKSGEWWSSHCSTDADESRIHLCSFDFLLLDEHIIAYSIANAMYTILANWIFCVFMHGKSDIF